MGSDGGRFSDQSKNGKQCATIGERILLILPILLAYEPPPLAK
jgi:hypothetical protein